ncbi:protein ripply2 [Pogona vitticeps]
MEGGEARGGTSPPPPPPRARRHFGRGLSLERRGHQSTASSPQLCLGNSPPPRPPPPGALNSRLCHQDQPGAEGFWRPWVPTPKDAERQRRRDHRALCSLSETTEDAAKLTHYIHPVRLFWPKSRCFDYLFNEAEALLRNFPVQATISFYEDSESEEGDDELDHDSEAELDC